MQNEPWWVVQVQGAPQQVRAMETELTFGVLLGEGKRVGKGERGKREREHTDQPHMGEREGCREIERRRDAKRQKAMERDE